MKKTHFILAAACLGLLLFGASGHAAPLAQWVWRLEDPSGEQSSITGLYSNGLFGTLTAEVGDLNCDGRDDLVITAPGVDTNGDLLADSEFNVLPGPIPFGSKLILPHGVALTLHGTDGQAAGNNLSTGDLNGDGCTDLIFTSYPSGTIYIYPGNPSIQLDTPVRLEVSPETMALTVRGAESILGVCDVNGDEYDDLFTRSITNTNTVGIFGGPEISLSQPMTIDLASDPVDLSIQMPEDDMGFTPVISAVDCGDVDGDGWKDLVIGSPTESPGGRYQAGRVYVVGGLPGILATTGGIITLPEQADAIIEGVDGNRNYWGGDSLGTFVELADVNGDGKDDLVLGAPNGDGPGPLRGELYLWLGQELTGQTVDLRTEATWVLHSDITAGTGFGAIFTAEDVDHDGRAEVIAGCPGCNRQYYPDYPPVGGSAYILDAEQIVGEQPIAAVARLEVPASQTVLYVGNSVNVGDLDGDGYLDVILGASAIGREYAHHPGAVYILSYPEHDRVFLALIGR